MHRLGRFLPTLALKWREAPLHVSLQSQKRPPCVRQDEFPAEEQPGQKRSEQHQRAAGHPACLLISTHFHAELCNIHTFVVYSQLRWPLGSLWWPVIQSWFSGAVCSMQTSSPMASAKPCHSWPWLWENLPVCRDLETTENLHPAWKTHFQEVRPSLMYVKSSVHMCVKQKCVRKLPEDTHQLGILLPEEEGWANTRVPGAGQAADQGIGSSWDWQDDSVTGGKCLLGTEINQATMASSLSLFSNF